MCGNNSCFGGNIWWIIILVLLLGCGNGCGNNDCGCGNNNNGGCQSPRGFFSLDKPGEIRHHGDGMN